MPDLKPGVVFAGHRIEGIAGRGGMGTVYRATHIALDHVVALKVIAADLAADDAFRERFRSESRIAVSLRHPNVVPIHHAGEEDGLLFVTMDLVDGPDLRRMLIADGTLKPDRAIAIVAQVASALDVAHSRGLVHRDIKPGNILVESETDDRAYLTDFGLAKRFDQATEASGLTRTGAFVGTLDYVAPEQIRGDRVDARTDVYALGCVMYEAIAGRAPFADREENVAKIYAHLQDEPPWLPGEGREEGALDEVIARALAKEPAARYPSAGDLARAATAAIEGQEVLRSAERSVATGKAAPETGEPVTPPLPIPETVEADAAPEPATEPEPTQPMSAVPATTAEHAGPTRVTAVDSEATQAAAPRSASTHGGGPRWGRLALATGVAAALVVAAVVILGGGEDPSTDGSTDPVANGSSTGSGGFGKPVVSGKPIGVEGMPVGIAVEEGTVAVATRSGQSVEFIEEGSGRVIGDVSLPGDGQDVTILDDSAWVTVPGTAQVVEVPLDASDQRTIEVASGPFGITSEDGSIWVAEPEARAISSIDPDTGVPSEPIVIDGSSTPSEIAAGAGLIWVVDRDGGLLFGVDPADGTIERQEPTGDNPKGVVVEDETVWVANTDGGDVDRFSTDGDELDPVEVGGHPRLLASGFDRIWVANENGYVSAIDPADDSVERIDVDGSPEDVAIGSEHVWVTTGLGDSVVRIDPSPPG